MKVQRKKEKKRLYKLNFSLFHNKIARYSLVPYVLLSKSSDLTYFSSLDCLYLKYYLYLCTTSRHSEW